MVELNRILPTPPCPRSLRRRCCWRPAQARLDGRGPALLSADLASYRLSSMAGRRRRRAAPVGDRLALTAGRRRRGPAVATAPGCRPASICCRLAPPRPFSPRRRPGWRQDRRADAEAAG